MELSSSSELPTWNGCVMATDKNDNEYCFIIGAPKAGTSTVFDLLSQYPEVNTSAIKEPHYFCSDLDRRAPLKIFANDEEYLSFCYPKITSKHRYLIEASASYLYSQVAANRIKKFSQNSKIIILLRNPIDAVYALYSQKKFGGAETLNFVDSIRAIEERLLGNKVSKNPGILETYDYIGTYKYYDQLKRYLDIFETKNILIIKYEDLVRDPLKIQAQLSSFLCLAPHEGVGFRSINLNKRIKNVALHRLIRYIRLNLVFKKIFPKHFFGYFVKMVEDL